MRVIVTGGSGFIGTNLVSALLSEGHDVQNIDLADPRDSGHERVWKSLDLLDGLSVSESFRDFEPQIVFHLAARTDLKGATLEDYAQNVDGVVNVVNAVRALKNKPRTVYASSRLVFAVDHHPSHDYDYKPSTVYGRSKVAGELYVRENAHLGGDWCLVRPTSIWGPWFGTPYRDFFDSIDKGRYVEVVGQDPRKSFGYVGNVVYELMKLAVAPSKAIAGQVFWLADYSPLLLSTWARMIALAMNRPPPRRVPKRALSSAARIGDLLKRVGFSSPLITSFRLDNLLTEMVYDTEYLEHVVGPLPYSLPDGVAETVSWLKNPHAGKTSGGPV